MPRFLLYCAILSMAASPVSAVGGDESLYAGLGAYKAGACDTALPLLQNPTDNPYCEIFRLYYRADCLLRDSLCMEAAAALETLFALVDSGAVAQSHRFIDRARDLYGETLSKSGICIPIPSAAPPSRIRNPSSRVWLLASRACLAAGDSARAMEHFTSAAAAGLTSADKSLFKELFHRCRSLLPACPDRSLLAIATRAADFGLFPEANAAVDFVLARRPDDPEALLCRARAAFESGEPEKALRSCWSIFYSTAPVGAKASALRRISSIEYSLKRYDKAAKHYFMHGTYYRSAQSLDLAARIYVMEKEWKEALAAWSILRERHRGARLDLPLWIEAGLSEAVLRSSMGESEKAHGIMKDILPRARGVQSAAALYWLMKTSSSDAERKAWSDSLLRARPRSFYALLAGGDESVLTPRSRDSDACGMDALARYAEDRRARFDAARADSVFERHAAYRAYTAFLDHGLHEEAEATARAIIGIRDLLYRPRESGGADAAESAAAPGVIPGRLFKLYADAAKRGHEALALTILSRISPADSLDSFPEEMWYPISHLEEIRAGAAPAGLSPLLVLAIIREESRFDPNVISPAGAIGLMQLMPATAAWHAGLAGGDRPGAEDLRDPARNIRAGIAYFRYLLERFDGSAVGALAAYNGGEGRMARWKDTFDPESNPVAAIELIGPRETRNYVRKVLDSYSAYVAIAREKAGAE